MTKPPETIDEVKARQATIAGGMGALGTEPLVKEEPGPGSLAAVMKKRQHARRDADRKITRWTA